MEEQVPRYSQVFVQTCSFWFFFFFFAFVIVLACLLFFSQRAHDFFVQLQSIASAAGGFCVLQPSEINPSPVEITADGTTIGRCILTVRVPIHTRTSAVHAACNSRGLVIVLHPDDPGIHSSSSIVLKDTSSQRNKNRPDEAVIQRFPSATKNTHVLYHLLGDVQSKLRALLVEAGVDRINQRKGDLNTAVKTAWNNKLQLRLNGVYTEAMKEKEAGTSTGTGAGSGAGASTRAGSGAGASTSGGSGAGASTSAGSGGACMGAGGEDMAESPDRIENRQLKAELAEQRRQHLQLERRFAQQQLEHDQKIRLMHRQCMQAVLARGDAADAQDGQGNEKTDDNQPRYVCIGIPMLNLYVTIA